MAKPNFLLILTDQQRADTISCAGNQVVRTPNLDRLCRSGVLFPRAYTPTPVCVPARMNILTGQDSCRLGILENAASIKSPILTLPSILTERGYFAQAIGKMHFRPRRNHYGFPRMLLSEGIPARRVDDDFLLYLKEKGFGHVEEPHGQRQELYYQPQVSVLPQEHHATSWTADRTVDFLAANRNRPFFCFCSFLKPHPPWDPPEPFASMYRRENMPLPVRCDADRDPKDSFLLVQDHSKWMDNAPDDLARLIKARYYGSVSHIDKNLGKILDALDAYELRENTIVIFTSDHGDLLGDHYHWGKRSYFEGGARIPFIISWPGQLPQGEVREEFVTLTDILPTFVETAGAVRPLGSSGGNIEGMQHTPETLWRDTLWGEYSRGRTAKYMLRTGDWKYIYMVNGGREQLFNLADDPNELDDLAGEMPDLCAGFRLQMARHYWEQGFMEALDGGEMAKLKFERLPLGKQNQQYPVWPKNEPK